jgi:H+-transporting ATPase
LFGRNGGTAPETAPDTCAFRSPRSRIAIFSTASIAETTRILLFMTATILIFNFYPVTAVMVVLLALLNDLPIMMIAYDNAPIALKPVRWDMRRVLTIASVLGTFGVFSSFGLFWTARDYLGLAAPVVQSLVFLKLLVAGHMTIYLTRHTGAIWQRPWPSWKLVVPIDPTRRHIRCGLWLVHGSNRLASRADGVGLCPGFLLAGERR